MGRKGKIERAGVEAEVLAMAQQGLGSRAIAKKLTAAHGFTISHVAVNRFLKEETDDRERSRRATTAAKAAEIAGKVGGDVDDNLGAMQAVVPVLGGMVRHGYHTITMPTVNDEGTPIPDTDPTIRHLPLEAKDRIRAASVLKDTAAYLIELAGANPRPTDPKNLEAIRNAIGEVFGYAEAPTAPEGSAPTVDAQEAPLTPEEHQPPVMH